MDNIIKNLFEKISSYDIFNNFFPGIVFCSIIKQISRFSFSSEELLEKLFLYYFIGMIISRIGSIVIEKLLKWTNLIEFAPYNDYIEASKEEPFIKDLSEKNNIYRTLIAMTSIISGVKLYDLIIALYTSNSCWSSDLLLFFIFLLITILFIYSYKKQTDYVRRRVEKYKLNKKNS